MPLFQKLNGAIAHPADTGTWLSPQKKENEIMK